MIKTIRNASTLIALICLSVGRQAIAYEINNHADVSENAVGKSVLATDVGPKGKLARLGLRNLQLSSDKQTFALNGGLGAIPYCFGSARPDPWLVTISDAGTLNAMLAQPSRDSTVAQPA